MDNGCIGCNQAKTEQNRNDEKIINLAKEMAKKENRDIGLYRDSEGQLAIVPTGASNYPICHIITANM